MSRSVRRQLQQLAALYGVQISYVDALQQRVQVSEESLLGVLKALGAEIDDPQQFAPALEARRAQLAARWLVPVVVVWDAQATDLQLQLPATEEGQLVRCRIEFETGGDQTFEVRLDASHVVQGRHIRSSHDAAMPGFTIQLPSGLPLGYHRLEVEVGERHAAATVFSAPRSCYRPDGALRRAWGVFVPLYSLYRQGSWGAGDFGDLETFMQWVSDQGGACVATLPVLASFHLSQGNSPYSPASRLFWNELFLDVEKIPELAHCQAAQQLLASPEFTARLAALRAAPRVDYQGQMNLKRRVLELLAAQLEHHSGERHAEYERYVQAQPALVEYARFRAVGERQGATWPQWPEPLRSGQIGAGDYDPQVVHYHQYVQWLCEQQVAGMSHLALDRKLAFYVDFPLGVHYDSFDVWRDQAQFALGASAGAPPDPLFSKGQAWGFPPLHPERLRDDGYRYWIASIRHHTRHADLLRIDHVMGLHRQFWVPSGLEAKQGAYVHYQPEEFYAILSIESHRNQCWVIGENLGTVPGYVNMAMKEHGLDGMYVLELNARVGKGSPLRAVQRTQVASLNTHDLPPFARYWQGLDIGDWVDLGLIDESQAEKDRQQRAEVRAAIVEFLRGKGLLGDDASELAVLRGTLQWLARSNSPLVLVSLEDLWLETEPQNVPGTWLERPNWLRRAKYSLEQFTADPEVQETLRRVEAARQTRTKSRTR